MTAQAGLFDDPAVIAPGPVLAPIARHFYRCCDCLTVVATLERADKATCGACGGAVEFMGTTTPAGTVRRLVGYACPCDARCTHARGPDCDCSCGGANHGSGAVVPVYVSEGMPRLQVGNAGRALMLASEYRRLVSDFRAKWAGRFGALADRKRAGQYLEGWEYARYMAGVRLYGGFREARGLRVHGARNKRLVGLIGEIR